MKPDRRDVEVSVLFVLFFCVFLIPLARAQESKTQRHLIQDWSNRHVIFTGLNPENIERFSAADARAWHSWLGHARFQFEPEFLEQRRFREGGRGRLLRALERDWSMPLGSTVGPLAAPAKFGFDPNAAPDCARDFVVFPTANLPTPGASGAGVNASLVAFNNLYTGPGPTGICPTPGAPAAQPSVLFAYNTATMSSSAAKLSPVISLDGAKIAFVESNDGAGSNYVAFHVLTWRAGEGTAWNSAAAPGNCIGGDSCMTTLVLSSTHSASKSNPFVDYAHDTAYVGDDGGRLHKITPVFNGTPAEVTGGGWPVQVGAAPTMVQSPVYDSVSGRVSVTVNNGGISVVDGTTGAIVNSQSLNTFDTSDPVVDSTNQTVFVFFSQVPSFALSVAQFDTSGNSLKTVHAGALSGDVSVFTGAFDNNYLTSPSSGLLYFAGAVSGQASVVSVSFTGTTMNGSASFAFPISTSSLTSLPTPLTEIFNPNLAHPKDLLFAGIDADCSAASPNGCMVSLDITNSFPPAILNIATLQTAGASQGVSGIIIDNVSALAQASSIYFESTPASGGTSGAIKLTQSGLQ